MELIMNTESSPLKSAKIKKKKVGKTTFGTDLLRRIPEAREITRHYTKAGVNPLDQLQYVKSGSKIKDTDGRTVFEMKDVEVPAGWSQLAVDILVSKYFRKAGVPGTGHEVSVRQVVKRIAHTIRVAGEAMGYFAGEAAQIYEDELSYCLVHQIGAFNSPVWFNLGLYHEYGIRGSGGNFSWDAESRRISSRLCIRCFINRSTLNLLRL